MTRRSRAATWHFACALLVAACSPAPRREPRVAAGEASAPAHPADECAALVAYVDVHLEDTSSARDLDEAVARARVLAAALERVAAQRKELKLGDRTLAKLADDYSALAADVGAAARELAAAAERGDLEGLAASQAEASAILAREDPIIEAIEAACPETTPPPEPSAPGETAQSSSPFDDRG